MRTTAYRYPREHLILTLTLILVLGVIAITVAATVCSSAIFFIGFILLSFYLGRSHHQTLLKSARRITPAETPELQRIVRTGVTRLQPGEVQVYVVPSRMLNAYTFGLSSPKVVVLYSGLIKVMDEDELLFILGHELGHVALGHTWLNSLVGGMAGIPAPFSAAIAMSMAFLWWNRSCEFSADRAGLLACGKPEKAVTALVKLVAGTQANTQSGLQRAYQQIDAEDDTVLGNLGEVMATHPMLIRRIEELRRFAASEKYRRLQSMVNRNA